MAKLTKYDRTKFLAVLLDDLREYKFAYNSHALRDYWVVREIIKKDDKKRKKEFKEFCTVNNYEVIYTVIKTHVAGKEVDTGYIAFAGYRVVSVADRAEGQAEIAARDKEAEIAAKKSAFDNWKRLRAVIRESSKCIVRWKGKFEGEATEWLDEDEISVDDNEHYYIYRIFVKEKDLHRMFNDWTKTTKYVVAKSTIESWLAEKPYPNHVWELLSTVIPYYTHWDKVIENGKRVRGKYQSSIFFKFESLGDDTKKATLW